MRETIKLLDVFGPDAESLWMADELRRAVMEFEGNCTLDFTGMRSMTREVGDRLFGELFTGPKYIFKVHIHQSDSTERFRIQLADSMAHAAISALIQTSAAVH